MGPKWGQLSQPDPVAQSMVQQTRVLVLEQAASERITTGGREEVASQFNQGPNQPTAGWLPQKSNTFPRGPGRG